jgi:endo-1,4-beta-xylanase
MRAVAGWCVLVAFGVAPAFSQGLRDLAAERGIRFGAAADPSFFAEGLYADTLAREYSQIEPENAMKFGPIHPQVNGYSFGTADSVVAFGRAHGMAVRGHTLVWHNQNPTWLTSGAYSSSQLSSILHDHIQTVVSHYKGQVYGGDAVNEAFDDTGNLRSTIWSDSPGIGLTGTGYIEQAFR